MNDLNLKKVALYLRLGLADIKTHKFYSLLTIGIIAIGLVNVLVILAIANSGADNPIPEKEQRLFQVVLKGYKGDPILAQDNIPSQLSSSDANTLIRQFSQLNQVSMTKITALIDLPDGKGQLEQSPVRVTNSDFFSAFNVPFKYGQPWSKAQDKIGEKVVVISADANQAKFGGRHSIGEYLLIEGHRFLVVGVLDDWQPKPRFYDMSNHSAEPYFIPLESLAVANIFPNGNKSCFGSIPGNITELRTAECYWLSHWVEFDTPEQKQPFEQFLLSHLSSKGIKDNGWLIDLVSVPRLLERRHAMSDDEFMLAVIAVLAYLVCLINAGGLIQARLNSKQREVKVRRMIGAKKTDIVTQVLIESTIIGLLSTLLSFTLLGFILNFINSTYYQGQIMINAQLVFICLLMGLLSSLLSSIYPALKLSRIAYNNT